LNVAGNQSIGRTGVRSIDIVALGEAMVEFNQGGDNGGRTYLQGFGGDPSNASIAAARQVFRNAELIE
jgi:2-dehydro-3-deoxygluconokinase